MKSKLATALAAVFALFLCMLPLPAQDKTSPEPAAPAGDWTVYFQAMGHAVPGKLHLEVDGERLSGTVETEHTGPGKVENGKWANNKLACTLVFERHESIVFEGELKSDNTLSGHYTTEGRTDTWRAERGEAKPANATSRSGSR